MTSAPKIPDPERATPLEDLAVGTALFMNSSEGIVITDESRKILRINPRFTAITGFEIQHLTGETPSILKSDRHDAEFFRQLDQALADRGIWQGEIWNRRRDGKTIPQWLTIIALQEKGQPYRYIGILSDIVEYLNRNTTMLDHAYHDSLTGLPNRVFMQDRLTFMLNLAHRNKAILGVLFIDLNRFKLINDTLGYGSGDLILKEVAQRLQSSIRDVDAVFRLGDDEFAVLLEDIQHTQDAARVAKRILSASSQPYLINEKELFITFSIGVSLFPDDGDRFDMLLKNAETAMLRAKELGIGNYQHYKPSMNTQAFEQLNLENNLQKALKDNQFIVAYQPIINLEDREIIGAEALVRWQHPDLGIIPPIKFIPLAEETGLIIPIGEWVLETACRQMRAWQTKFGRPFIVSVNLSARQFQQPDLATTIQQVLTTTQIDPRTLKLEITESIGMKDPEQTIDILNALKAKGMLIAIDDFGTGYSSLSYLKRFPIDTVKIDRSFVMEMQETPNDTAIIDAIIALAHSLNLSVTAEGVETLEQSEYLRKKGCEQVQGYYFSRPVFEAEFEQLLIAPPWQAPRTDDMR